jgi:hypothetical protein
VVKPWRLELLENLPESLKQEIEFKKLSIETPSARQTAFWLLDIAKEKKEEEKLKHKNFIEKLCNICAEAKKLQELGKEFISEAKKTARLQAADEFAIAEWR